MIEIHYNNLSILPSSAIGDCWTQILILEVNSDRFMTLFGYKKYECKRISSHASDRSASATGFTQYPQMLLITFLVAWYLRSRFWFSSEILIKFLLRHSLEMIAYEFRLCSVDALSFHHTSSILWFTRFPFWVGSWWWPFLGWWFLSVGFWCCCLFQWLYFFPAKLLGYRFYSFLLCICW